MAFKRGYKILEKSYKIHTFAFLTALAVTKWKSLLLEPS